MDSQRIVSLLLTFLRKKPDSSRDTKCEQFIQGLSYDNSCTSSTGMDISTYCRRTPIHPSNLQLVQAFVFSSCRNPDVCFISLCHSRNRSSRSNHMVFLRGGSRSKKIKKGRETKRQSSFRCSSDRAFFAVFLLVCSYSPLFYAHIEEEATSRHPQEASRFPQGARWEDRAGDGEKGE